MISVADSALPAAAPFSLRGTFPTHLSMVKSSIYLKPQVLPYGSPMSQNLFQPSVNKPFVATEEAICGYTAKLIDRCLAFLQAHAARQKGLDYLQVFEKPDYFPEDLWFIEVDRAIIAMVPSDYLSSSFVYEAGFRLRLAPSTGLES